MRSSCSGWIFVLLMSTTVFASDHLDSQYIDEHPQADIGDIWAFPTDNGIVFAASFNPLTDPTLMDQMKLDQDVLYEFKIDTDGDNVADLAYKISVEGLEQEQKLVVRRATGTDAIATKVAGEIVLKGKSSTAKSTTINKDDGFRLFVGPRQDPFFFNFKGVQSPSALMLQYALGADGLPSDGSWVNTFGPTNVTLLVLEVAELDGEKFGVWGTTALDGKQVDRCGRSSVTAVFLPNPATGRNPIEYPYGTFKQKYNTTRPVDDRTNYGKMFRHTLKSLQADESLADFYLPDILQYDPSKPGTYPNGRNLYDDSVYWTVKNVNPFMESPSGLPEKNPQNLSKDFPFAAPPIANPESGRNEYIIKLIDKMYDSIGDHDIDAVASACSPTVKWECFGPTDAEYSGVFAGPSGVKEHFKQLSNAYKLKDLKVQRKISQGSFVTAIVKITAVDTGSGKAIDLNVTHCWEVTDNRISRVREYLSVGNLETHD